jgi:Polyketide cyclase / dehydrase and lipid transport.
MRRIKLFVIGVCMLLAFLCLATIFLPSHIIVSKTVVMNVNEEKVAEQIQNFQNWKNWYPLFQDANINVSITRNMDTSFATLTNQNQKRLRLILLKSAKDFFTIFLNEKSKNNETYYFILKANGTGETQLTWNINMELGWYPWKKFAGILMDKIKGPQYEAILQNLKTAAESAGN